MPTKDLALRKRAITVAFNADGTVAGATLVSDLIDVATGTALGTPKEKAYTPAQAAAAGVTGAQNTSFQNATNSLNTDYQTALLGV